MGLISRFKRMAAVWTSPSVSDDGHWTTSGGEHVFTSQSGAVVTQATALRLSAVYACVKIITEAVGTLPLLVYDKGPDDTRTRSTGPLADRLALDPNEEQTAFEFKEMLQGWALFRSYSHARISWDGIGQPESIMPLHPDRLRRLKGPDGARRYEFLQDDNTTWLPIPDNEIFRLPGTPVLDYARDTFGMAQSLESFTSNSFKKGVRPSGFIAQDPTVSYDDDARALIKARIEEEHGGATNAQGTLWLPEGLKWNQLGMTNQQAQTIEQMNFSVTEITRFFRVPPYMVGVLDEGSVSYASVSQQSLDFIVYTLAPWFQRWSDAVGRDLIMRPSEQFAEFLTAAMLRGTTAERYAVYAVALQWRIMNRNEVRKLENLAPVTGGEEFDLPANMAAPDQLDAGSPASNLLSMLTSDAAGRIVRRETAALPKLLEKGDAAVDEFYETHVTYVAEAMHISVSAARSYTSERRRDADSVTTWDVDGIVAGLSAMSGVEPLALAAPGGFNVPAVTVAPSISIDTKPMADAIFAAEPPTVVVEPAPPAPINVTAVIDPEPIAAAIAGRTVRKTIKRDTKGQIIEIIETST